MPTKLCSSSQTNHISSACGIYNINHIHINSGEEASPTSNKGQTKKKKNVAPRTELNIVIKNVFPTVFQQDLSATILKFFPSSLPSFANHALIIHSCFFFCACHFTYCIAFLDLRPPLKLAIQGGTNSIYYW